jgi:hypothetical protein
MFPRAKYRDDSEVTWQSFKSPSASLKRDGGSYYLTIDDKGNQRYFSRRPSVKGGYPERTSVLPHITSVKLPQFAGHVFNVELIHTGHDKATPESHPKVSGILNSLTEKSLQTQKETGPVRAVLLDVVNPPFSTYRDKLLHMKALEKAVGKPDLLFVDTPEITIPGIVKLIAKTKAEGREGVVITDLEAPEYKNVRVKIKHKNTMNLRVVRILQEVDIRGNPKPSAGALELADATGRIVGKVGTGFTKQDREDIWNNQEEWLTKVVQVTFRNIVREGGMLIQPAYNGLSDGEVDSIREFNK